MRVCARTCAPQFMRAWTFLCRQLAGHLCSKAVRDLLTGNDSFVRQLKVSTSALNPKWTLCEEACVLLAHNTAPKVSNTFVHLLNSQLLNGKP